VKKNLSHIPNLPKNQLEDSARRVFENFALTLCDFFHPEELEVSFSNGSRENIEQARQRGRGAVLVTFHMGHWELGGRMLGQWGWPVTAIYQPYRSSYLQRIIQTHRAPGIAYVPVGQGAATTAMEVLRRGEIVAVLGDRPFGERGLPVQLLGRRVRWPRGPVLLAIRAKAAITVAVVVREKPGGYVIMAEPPLMARGASYQEVERLTQSLADSFGKLVQKFPDQWYRFEPLWELDEG